MITNESCVGHTHQVFAKDMTDRRCCVVTARDKPWVPFPASRWPPASLPTSAFPAGTSLQPPGYNPEASGTCDLLAIRGQATLCSGFPASPGGRDTAVQDLIQTPGVEAGHEQLGGVHRQVILQQGQRLGLAGPILRVAVLPPLPHPPPHPRLKSSRRGALLCSLWWFPSLVGRGLLLVFRLEKSPPLSELQMLSADSLGEISVVFGLEASSVRAE